MRTYVITGAAHCIGLATARLLADQGHTVLGVDLHDADITADITADLASPAGHLALVDEVTRRSGGQFDAITRVNS